MAASRLRCCTRKQREQVNSSIDLVVQLVRGQDGTRRMVEVSYLASRRREPFALARLVHWEGGSGVEHKGFVRHKVHPVLAQKFADAGEVLPDGFVVSHDIHDVDAGGGITWS